MRASCLLLSFRHKRGQQRDDGCKIGHSHYLNERLTFELDASLQDLWEKDNGKSFLSNFLWPNGQKNFKCCHPIPSNGSQHILVAYKMHYFGPKLHENTKKLGEWFFCCTASWLYFLKKQTQTRHMFFFDKIIGLSWGIYAITRLGLQCLLANSTRL